MDLWNYMNTNTILVQTNILNITFRILVLILSMMVLRIQDKERKGNFKCYLRNVRIYKERYKDTDSIISIQSNNMPINDKNDNISLNDSIFKLTIKRNNKNNNNGRNNKKTSPEHMSHCNARHRTALHHFKADQVNHNHNPTYLQWPRLVYSNKPCRDERCDYVRAWDRRCQPCCPNPRYQKTKKIYNFDPNQSPCPSTSNSTSSPCCPSPCDPCKPLLCEPCYPPCEPCKPRHCEPCDPCKARPCTPCYQICDPCKPRSCKSCCPPCDPCKLRPCKPCCPPCDPCKPPPCKPCCPPPCDPCCPPPCKPRPCKPCCPPPCDSSKPCPCKLCCPPPCDPCCPPPCDPCCPPPRRHNRKLYQCRQIHQPCCCETKCSSDNPCESSSCGSDDQCFEIPILLYPDDDDCGCSQLPQYPQQYRPNSCCIPECSPNMYEFDNRESYSDDCTVYCDEKTEYVTQNSKFNPAGMGTTDCCVTRRNYPVSFNCYC